MLEHSAQTLRDLRKRIRDNNDRALCRLLLAYFTDSGIRLSADEVYEICRDDALHTRFRTEQERLEDAATKGGV